MFIDQHVDTYQMLTPSFSHKEIARCNVIFFCIDDIVALRRRNILASEDTSVSYSFFWKAPFFCRWNSIFLSTMALFESIQSTTGQIPTFTIHWCVIGKPDFCSSRQSRSCIGASQGPHTCWLRHLRHWRLTTDSRNNSNDIIFACFQVLETLITVSFICCSSCVAPEVVLFIMCMFQSVRLCLGLVCVCQFHEINTTWIYWDQ